MKKLSVRQIVYTRNKKHLINHRLVFNLSIHAYTISPFRSVIHSQKNLLFTSNILRVGKKIGLFDKSSRRA